MEDNFLALIQKDFMTQISYPLHVAEEIGKHCLEVSKSGTFWALNPITKQYQKVQILSYSTEMDSSMILGNKKSRNLNSYTLKFNLLFNYDISSKRIFENLDLYYLSNLLTEKGYLKHKLKSFND